MSNGIYTKVSQEILTKFTVDPANQFINHSPKILVLLDILPTGYGNLDQNNLSYPFWMITEEDLECVQFLRDSFYIIKTVYPDHELHSLEFLFERGYPFLDLLLLKSFLEFLRVDTDRKGATGNNLALELDAIRGCCKASSTMLASIQSSGSKHALTITLSKSSRNAEYSHRYGTL